MTTIAMVIQHGAEPSAHVDNLAKDLGLEVFDYRLRELSIAVNSQPSLRRFGSWFRLSSARYRMLAAAAAGAARISDECREALRSRNNILVVGWHAVLSLSANEYDVRVLLHAPREIRIARFAHQDLDRSFVDMERAFDRMEDQMSAYLEVLNGRDWLVSHRFDLAINVSRCTPHTFSALIHSWLQTSPIAKSEITGEPQTRLEPITLAATAGRRVARTFTILDGERVDLTGVQSHEAAIAAIEQRLHKECYRRHN
jgi:cytidylate kinase